MTTFKRVINKLQTLIATSIFVGVLMLGTSGLILVVVVRYFTHSSSSWFNTDSVSRLSQYPELLEFHADWEAIEHFPKRIPDHAKSPSLYYLKPNIRFGGPYIFELSMQLPKEEILTLQTEYREKAKRQYESDNINNSPSEEKGPNGERIIYDYFLYTEHEVMNESPGEFAFYVLEDTRGAPEYRDGYAIRYGVAINVSASVIVYWMTDEL